MAAIEKLNIPNKVVESDWKDDIDVGYATYGDEQQEMEYVPPEKVSKESIDKIKARKTGHNILTIFTQKDDRIAA